MKTITTQIYTIDELAPDVRERVIEENRYFNVEHDWYTFLYETFIEERMRPLGYSNIDIAFTGFHSQGDGASFTATLNICQWLRAYNLQAKYQKAYTYAEEYGEESIIEIIRTSSSYTHENTCDAELVCDEPSISKYDDKGSSEIMQQLDQIHAMVEAERLELCKELYSQLKEYYEYQTEDEQILESLRENDYEYLADGRIY